MQTWRFPRLSRAELPTPAVEPGVREMSAESLRAALSASLPERTHPRMSEADFQAVQWAGLEHPEAKRQAYLETRERAREELRRVPEWVDAALGVDAGASRDAVAALAATLMSSELRQLPAEAREQLGLSVGRFGREMRARGEQSIPVRHQGLPRNYAFALDYLLNRAQSELAQPHPSASVRYHDGWDRHREAVEPPHVDIRFDRFDS